MYNGLQNALRMYQQKHQIEIGVMELQHSILIGSAVEEFLS
jgi:hypothetical protein